MPPMGIDVVLLVMLNNTYEPSENCIQFNTIQPHLLMDKMVNLGVNSLLIKWINNFLVNCTQQVKFNSTISTSRMVSI
jgi:hypothetical protein